MKYTEITKEQQEKIKSFFSGYGTYSSVEFEFKTEEDGYYISVSQMYEYVGFKDMTVLKGYLAIAEVLGCENGDEVDRDSYGGCETCEYGSKYSIELKFW